MAIVRVEKTKDYTVLSNAHFREREMSLKAKGLLSLMLSLPDGWDFSISGLVALSKDGKESVMNALSELEAFGYLRRVKRLDEKKRFAGYDYNVFENPNAENPNAENPNAENPNAENPNAENPNAENPTQLNTNISIPNLSKTKESITKEYINCPPNGGALPETLQGYSGSAEKSGAAQRFKKPAVDEVARYCSERGNGVDAQRFVDYYDSNGWRVGKNPMKDWKACVRTWEKNAYSSAKMSAEERRESRYCKPSAEYLADEAKGLPF